MINAAQAQIFEKAVGAIAAMVGKSPVLYGPNNSPLVPSSGYTVSRSAAKRAGSMKNWVPRRLITRQQEALERESMVDRASDLTSNDAHAAGVVDSFAITAIGHGLTPHLLLDHDILNLSKEEVRRITAQQKASFLNWSPFADAGGRMSFGAIQFQIERCLIQFGEFLVLLPMLDDPSRPYSLACQVLNPLRLKTPVDLVNQSNIRDGVELGSYGEPAYYWIKKSNPNVTSSAPDISANFLRIPAKRGHRWNVLHGFISKDPEQVRGVTFFAPAMKLFRDLNDYLDAELVSNIVTAAFALFIENSGGGDPTGMANYMASYSETNAADGTPTRYQAWTPGQILYGNAGEKPSPISAARPGVTFEPFTRVIKKAIALSVNIPYPILFKDVDGLSYAGWRGAMLDAWRVYMHHRNFIGEGPSQKIYTMLQEEAYLRGHLKVKNFYTNIYALTKAGWRGAPKGDIEPIKAAQADLLLVKGNMKTRASAIAELGGDIRTTFDQLAEEQEMMRERGLTEQEIDDQSLSEESGKKSGSEDTGTVDDGEQD